MVCIILNMLHYDELFKQSINKTKHKNNCLKRANYIVGTEDTEEMEKEVYEAIDRHSDQMRIRPKEQTFDGGSEELRGEHGRGELGGMLGWEEPWCNPFRNMLVHLTLVPHLNVILGKGFRMDHQMFLLSMDKGAEGFIFRGASGPGFDPNQYYIFRNGRMYNGLTVVTFQLTEF